MKIAIEREDDGRWIAEVEDLMVYGTTRQDAIAKVEALAIASLPTGWTTARPFPSSMNSSPFRHEPVAFQQSTRCARAPRTMIPRILAFLSCISLLLLCPRPEVCAAEDEAFNSVSGIVVDGLGRPVGQAELIFYVRQQGDTVGNPKLKVRTNADGAYSGDIGGHVHNLSVFVWRDGYAGHTVDYGPRWQESKTQDARLLLRKKATLVHVEQLARVNGNELRTGVVELLSSSWGENVFLAAGDSERIMDALFQVEHHVRPVLKALVTDENVGKTAVPT